MITAVVRYYTRCLYRLVTFLRSFNSAIKEDRLVYICGLWKKKNFFYVHMVFYQHNNTRTHYKMHRPKVAFVHVYYWKICSLLFLKYVVK